MWFHAISNLLRKDWKSTTEVLTNWILCDYLWFLVTTCDFLWLHSWYRSGSIISLVNGPSTSLLNFIQRFFNDVHLRLNRCESLDPGNRANSCKSYIPIWSFSSCRQLFWKYKRITIEYKLLLNLKPCGILMIAK